ncbi:hypothetical protein D9M72_476280 [compost metagenome]
MPVAAAAVGQSQLVVELELRQFRRDADRHRLRDGIRRQRERQRLEGIEQGIGADVIGALHFAVDGAVAVQAIGKVAAVQHQVAVDGGSAAGAGAGDQLGHFLRHQLGIAAAAQVDIAVDGAVEAGLRVGVERGLPAVVGSQQLQAGEGGDQLHGRGRIHRLLRVPAGARAGCAQSDYVEARGRSRHAGAAQGRGNLCRHACLHQASIGGRRGFCLLCGNLVFLAFLAFLCLLGFLYLGRRLGQRRCDGRPAGHQQGGGKKRRQAAQQRASSRCGSRGGCSWHGGHVNAWLAPAG